MPKMIRLSFNHKLSIFHIKKTCFYNSLLIVDYKTHPSCYEIFIKTVQIFLSYDQNHQSQTDIMQAHFLRFLFDYNIYSRKLIAKMNIVIINN